MNSVSYKTFGVTILVISLVTSLFFCAESRASSACEGTSAPQLRVLTYNILTKDNFFQTGPWNTRRQMIAEFIRAYKYDVMGVQEALGTMLDDLSSLLPEYSYAGVGRDDGQRKGEFSAIFYRKEHIELLETKTFWLSTTPETPGVIGWDARCPRIVTWAHFRDRRTGSTFYVFNTHFDHLGKQAQRNSAGLLAAEAKRISQGQPTIVLGDFNVAEKSTVYDLFKSASGLTDAISLVKHQGPRWSHSFYGWFKSKIDFIFVSPSITVCEHAITPENPFSVSQRSDHLPVSAVVKIREF